MPFSSLTLFPLLKFSLLDWWSFLRKNILDGSFFKSTVEQDVYGFQWKCRPIRNKTLQDRNTNLQWVSGNLETVSQLQSPSTILIVSVQSCSWCRYTQSLQNDLERIYLSKYPNRPTRLFVWNGDSKCRFKRTL